MFLFNFFYRWKLDPSAAVVQVKEGNMALPFGVLAVKGFDVTGTVSSFGSPIEGIYVLLYSKEVSYKLTTKIQIKSFTIFLTTYCIIN